MNKQWKKLTKNPFLSDYFVIIFFPAVVAWHYHEGQAVRLMLVCVAAAAAFEALFQGVVCQYALKKPKKQDFPLAIFMGLCTAMAMPVSAPLWFPVFGLLFGFAVASFAVPFVSKWVPFFTKVQIMPAVAAIAFLSFFRKTMFAYTPYLAAGASGTELETLSVLPSLGYMLKNGAFPAKGMYSSGDILTGAVTGPVGAACIVVLLAAFAYLLLRRPAFILAPTSFLLTAAVWAFLFPRGQVGRLASVGYELSAGVLLFTAVFLLSLPRFLPRDHRHKLIYGAVCALLTMLLRRIGPFEETVCAAIFIMSFTLPFFNRRAAQPVRARRVKREKPAQPESARPNILKTPPTQEEILEKFLKDKER
ncbi:MAG: RnfABCDGE type electron transport complex subunit D [Oscillospiraceae bacterium]|nr:RnfABCDGE type electron transport complex subunit D [Oscillospiraceae bacterium]